MESKTIHEEIRDRNKAHMENILETLCKQWERSPDDKFLQEQIQKYGESYERQFGCKFKRIYRPK